MTLIAVSVVFLISFLPRALVITFEEAFFTRPLFQLAYRVAVYLTYLNFAANPCIYYLTVRSYKVGPNPSYDI